MPNTMYTDSELREPLRTTASDRTYAYWYSFMPAQPEQPMSRKKARKAYRAAEDDFYAAKAAVETAEYEAKVQRGSMDAARERMDEAARILASDK